MKEGVRYSFAVLLSVALVGCNPVKEETPKVIGAVVSSAEPAKMTKVEKIQTNQAKTKAITLIDRVVWNAKKQQGVKYVWGGTSPKTGFDCSGLMQYAFKNGAQVALPRTAAEQYRVATKIPATQASKGDLVFFRTNGGSRISHVGLYLGDKRFLHAPRTGKPVAVSDLKGYWERTLVGFGRIPGACRPSYY